MAIARIPPVCGACGMPFEAVYKDQSDLPQLMQVIGDTFIGWDYANHKCKHMANSSKKAMLDKTYLVNIVEEKRDCTIVKSENLNIKEGISIFDRYRIRPVVVVEIGTDGTARSVNPLQKERPFNSGYKSDDEYLAAMKKWEDTEEERQQLPWTMRSQSVQRQTNAEDLKKPWYAFVDTSDGKPCFVIVEPVTAE